MASRRHYHSPKSKHYLPPETRHDERGFVIAMLERAITEVLTGNFVRAQGLIASQIGTIKKLAQQANQGVDPFTDWSQRIRPIKTPRERRAELRAGRELPLRVSLGERLKARGLDDIDGEALAGKWPPE